MIDFIIISPTGNIDLINKTYRENEEIKFIVVSPLNIKEKLNEDIKFVLCENLDELYSVGLQNTSNDLITFLNEGDEILTTSISKVIYGNIEEDIKNTNIFCFATYSSTEQYVLPQNQQWLLGKIFSKNFLLTYGFSFVKENALIENMFNKVTQIFTVTQNANNVKFYSIPLFKKNTQQNLIPYISKEYVDGYLNMETQLSNLGIGELQINTLLLEGMCYIYFSELMTETTSFEVIQYFNEKIKTKAMLDETVLKQIVPIYNMVLFEILNSPDIYLYNSILKFPSLNFGEYLLELNKIQEV